MRTKRPCLHCGTSNRRTPCDPSWGQHRFHPWTDAELLVRAIHPNRLEEHRYAPANLIGQAPCLSCVFRAQDLCQLCGRPGKYPRIPSAAVTPHRAVLPANPDTGRPAILITYDPAQGAQAVARLRAQGAP